MSNLPWAWISNSIFISQQNSSACDCAWRHAWWCTVHANLNLNSQTDILRKWHYEHVRLTRECSNYSNSDTANCRQQKGGCQGNLIACALNILQCQKHTTRLVRVVNSNSLYDLTIKAVCSARNYLLGSGCQVQEAKNGSQSLTTRHADHYSNWKHRSTFPKRLRLEKGIRNENVISA